MTGLKDCLVDINRISPDDGNHYFYGYYDNPAFDISDRYHLCNKVSFWDRLPVKDDVNQMGMIDMQTGKFIPLAETTAWNFQQGAMLQWNPIHPDSEIIYNVRSGDEYKCVVQNIKTGKKRELSRAVANVSQDGKWGLAINFKRIYDLRAGYGYAGVKDPFYDVPQPKDDGVYVVDMLSGESKFVLSYEQIAKWFNPDIPGLENSKITINHITFNSDASRFLFLIRDFPPKGNSGRIWYTGLGTVDRDGKNFHKMNPYYYASHYNWRDKDHLLIYASSDMGTGMYLFKDQTSEKQLLSPELFTMDIHCNYSPNRKYFVGDGYPDSDGYRPVFLYNTETQKGIQILRARSHPKSEGDIRTDLHVRWNRAGTLISFDSTHEDFRGVYTADLSKILKKF